MAKFNPLSPALRLAVSGDDYGLVHILFNNSLAEWGRVSALPLLPAGERIKPKYYEEEVFGFSLGCSGGGVPRGPFDWSYLLPIFCLIFSLFFYVKSLFYRHPWC